MSTLLGTLRSLLYLTKNKFNRKHLIHISHLMRNHSSILNMLSLDNDMAKGIYFSSWVFGIGDKGIFWARDVRVEGLWGERVGSKVPWMRSIAAVEWSGVEE